MHPIKSDYLVLGLGLTGISCITYLLDNQHTVICADSRPDLPQVLELKKAHPDLSIHIGEFTDQLLMAAEKIVVSPGIPLTHPAIQKAIRDVVPRPAISPKCTEHCIGSHVNDKPDKKQNQTGAKNGGGDDMRNTHNKEPPTKDGAVEAIKNRGHQHNGKRNGRCIGCTQPRIDPRPVHIMTGIHAKQHQRR